MVMCKALLLAVVFSLSGFDPVIAQLRAEDLAVINEESFYPEGPFWFMDNLYYTEMSKDRLMRWDGTRNIPVWSSPGCGPTSIAEGASHSMIILCHLQNSLVKSDLMGRTLRVFDRDNQNRPFLAPNASINDGKGGLYFTASGIFAPNAPATGAVYYLGPDEVIRKVADKIWYANGIALSQDRRTLFVSEHLGRRLLAYPVQADATLADRRVFVDLNRIKPSGETTGWDVGPDGLAVDQRDNLYIAEYGASQVLIVDKNGTLLSAIHFPERYVTAPRFGATEERIFVTAPSNNTKPPFVGKVYSVANPVYKKGK